jgi:aldehyde:ferredoxin oxidoreductase
MAAGYMGKILFVDLSTGAIKEEMLEDSLYRNYLGGYGLGVRILYSRQKAGVDPLGPENTLGLISGPLTGTAVPTGARFAAVGKSPITGGWGDANCGGEFGPYLKFAGFDGVFFTGISPKPVYLLLDNGKAEIKDAGQVWGKDCYETEDSLMAEYGKDSRVACIGQAGEKLALISCIMTDYGSAAGRSGLGAVMGSKRLKAVVARGNQEVKIAEKETLQKLRMDHIKSLQAPGPSGGPSFLEKWHKYGTSGGTFISAHSGDTPVKNWGGVGMIDVPDRRGLDPDLVATYVERLSGCWRCPISCKAILKEGTGKYKYAAGSRRPEYETQGSFGVNCGNSDTDSINKANDICNRYGMDTISAGTVVAFAMECYENGLLSKKDTGGIELKWGNHNAMVEMAEKVGKREGLGDILADGVKLAAERIGKGAEKFAVHIGGQEVGMHDPKLLVQGRSIFAAYRMDATPGRHSAGFGPGSFGKQLVNSLGVCLVGYGFGGAPDVPQKMAGFMTAVTGQTYTVDELMRAAERIIDLRHAFNLREGIWEYKRPIHPRVIGNPPLKEGPLAGVIAPMEAQDLWSMGALDWDFINGKPSKKRLLSLGLDDIAEELWPQPPKVPANK